MELLLISLILAAGRRFRMLLVLFQAVLSVSLRGVDVLRVLILRHAVLVYTRRSLIGVMTYDRGWLFFVRSCPCRRILGQKFMTHIVS